MNPAIQPIRHAITRGDYAQAAALWSVCAGELEDRIRAGQLPPSEWSQVAELLSWSRRVLLCARGQALGQLNEIKVAGAYRNSVP